MTEKLKPKPCPFCGSKVQIKFSDTKKTCFVVCSKCHKETPKYRGKEKAITEWNKTVDRYSSIIKR